MLKDFVKLLGEGAPLKDPLHQTVGLFRRAGLDDDLNGRLDAGAGIDSETALGGLALVICSKRLWDCFGSSPAMAR